jgi:hypothetical protein
MHLWIVGGLSTLWNAYGCYDYLMTQTRNQAYLAQFTEAQRAYVESFPALAQGAWALGVWGALAGSLLLLARSRWAVAAFGVSLFGLAASTVYQHLLSRMPGELMDGAMMVLSLAIWAIVVGLLLYALAMRRRGVLR